MPNINDILNELFNANLLHQIVYFLLICKYKNLESGEKYQFNNLNYEFSVLILDNEKIVTVSCSDGRKLIVKLVLCNKQNKYSDYLAHFDYDSTGNKINISSNLIRVYNGLELLLEGQDNLMYSIDDFDIDNISKCIFSDEELEKIIEKTACLLGCEVDVAKIKKKKKAET